MPIQKPNGGLGYRWAEVHLTHYNIHTQVAYTGWRGVPDTKKVDYGSEEATSGPKEAQPLRKAHVGCGSDAGPLQRTAH